MESVVMNGKCRAGKQALKRQHGFSYPVALFTAAVAAAFAMHAQINVATMERRGKEAQLMYVGQAYQNAIRSYYEGSQGSDHTYPPDFNALLLDTRHNRHTCHLRRAYWDPITASANWGVIRAPDGGIMGVYSLSTQQPIKIDGFPDSLSNFIGAKHYQDWKFVYQPM
jgi:type II secretory pathway pseudopilin PulG